MTDRRDKLGRRIPTFDRSAAGKKAAETQKEKYGLDKYKRTRAASGSKRTRGNFGKLATENPTAFKEISSKGGKSGIKHFARLKEENPDEFRKLSARGGKHPKRSGNSVSGD